VITFRHFAELYLREERRPDAYDLIHHAWMRGTYAAEQEFTDPMRDCPYAQRQYRMAWFWGYDIGRRIGLRNERIKQLQDLI